MPLAARRSYRLAFTAGLALALGYALGLTIPYLPPILALLLGAKPAPPPGAKQTLVLSLFLALALGIGLLIGPLLQFAPVPALLIVACGLFFSNRLAILKGKEAPATLLAFGFTVITAASAVSQALASAIIAAMVVGIVVTVVSQWLLYPLFPEDPGPPPPAPPAPDVAQGDWLCLRATLIVMPAFLIAMSNVALYLPFLVKSILLGREATQVRLRQANRELLGSTALGGLCAVLVWFCLGLAVNLWFYTGWVTLVCLVLGGATFGALRSRLAPTFWINTMTTMLILLGAAVQDSANGRDVYQAFAVRMALFFAVTLYALLAMHLLEWWRGAPRALEETPEC
ncbi:DUF2955 domain-containing protein [Mangrovimicrobium sediminis]|uniref:DUF2955 domain-containing protein n=1 Tax=Mangrovimicrobium sediminis TaxID=2562682 RepID=A0A4Z0M062_9GAMM|nr:DUF2955 domain-containing protein [Haliea sp. SAOS-164]TGD72685.1 DUF2955 domain-containing protein [Haliea sp. SAOS-164]